MANGFSVDYSDYDTTVDNEDNFDSTIISDRMMRVIQVMVDERIAEYVRNNNIASTMRGTATSSGAINTNISMTLSSDPNTIITDIPNRSNTNINVGDALVLSSRKGNLNELYITAVGN